MSATAQIPKATRALVLRKSTRATKPVYHDAVLEQLPIPELKPGQVLHWIRKGLYPGIGFGSVLGGDGAGQVVASADENDALLQKRVFLVPMRGWERDPDAPESHFYILGGGKTSPLGTFTQYVVVERDQVIPTPEHLDDVHAAAWPIGAVTAVGAMWHCIDRATMVNGHVKAGDNVLITGIGGGVALIALQLCVARGANVYVTSGSQDKIRKAVELGAIGGVSYKADDWPAQLAALLKKNGASSLSVVVDAGGGDIMGKTSGVLKAGGRVVVFGMHAAPKVTMTMREVLKNQKLLAGPARRDRLLARHRIVPVVSDVLDELESAARGFAILERGEHFGKVVIRIAPVAPAAAASDSPGPTAKVFPAKL
ncbi:hypothetical protein BN946_scf185014.g142 [Trametes cinnabarina]|uniref:Enoyl reductase (ER) domain-containing protein n=1 Tax=Pycnoporus cinnabarinus TaxID=5643 RepID=A0A060SGN2_PYCCI|nr:hypothetical protein BN946_scf185014.g142 [Trametes cinnabarina]